MNYNTEAENFTGKKIAVQYGWIAKDGPFKGQECYYIPKSTIGWIPACDLQDLKPISFVRLKDMLNSLGLGS